MYLDNVFKDDACVDSVFNDDTCVGVFKESACVLPMYYDLLHVDKSHFKIHDSICCHMTYKKLGIYQHIGKTFFVPRRIIHIFYVLSQTNSSQHNAHRNASHAILTNMWEMTMWNTCIYKNFSKEKVNHT